MIRRASDGRYFCDGRYCGYPLAWCDAGREDGEPGMWVCLDCNSSIYASDPKTETQVEHRGAAA